MVPDEGKDGFHSDAQAALSGFPRQASESSPGEGVKGGSPATPEPQPGEPAEGPVPYDRFQEVNEEKNRLKGQLETYQEIEQDPDFLAWAANRYSSLPQTEPTQPQVPAQPEPVALPKSADSQANDSGEEWLEGLMQRSVEGILDKRLAKMEGFIQSQEQARLTSHFKQQLSQLEMKYESFETNRDGPHLVTLMKQGRARTLDDAYKLAFFERGAVAGADAGTPGHDMGSASAPAGEVEDAITTLRKRATDPRTPQYEREALLGKIAAMKVERSGFLDQLGM